MPCIRSLPQLAAVYPPTNAPRHRYSQKTTLLKYKHSGATGKLVGVASIEDMTVYYGSNSTAMSAARISTTVYHGTMVPGTMVPWYHGTRYQWHLRIVHTFSLCYHGRVRTRVRTRVPWYHTNDGIWYSSTYLWYHGTPTTGSVPVAPECLYFKSFLR